MTLLQVTQQIWCQCVTMKKKTLYSYKIAQDNTVLQQGCT